MRKKNIWKYIYLFFCTKSPQRKWKIQISHWRSTTRAIYGNIQPYFPCSLSAAYSKGNMLRIRLACFTSQTLHTETLFEQRTIRLVSMHQHHWTFFAFLFGGKQLLFHTERPPIATCKSVIRPMLVIHPHIIWLI